MNIYIYMYIYNDIYIYIYVCVYHVYKKMNKKINEVYVLSWISEYLHSLGLLDLRCEITHVLFFIART
jgi:hypothetical protein